MHAQTILLNQLYDKLRLYHNFFQPVMRLKEKVTDPITNRIKRLYTPPLPPFDRLCKTGLLSPQQEQQLRQLRETTNPFSLRQENRSLLDRLWTLPPASDEKTEDIYLTLGLWESVQKTTAHFPTGSATAALPLNNHEKGEDSSVTLSFDRTMTRLQSRFPDSQTLYYENQIRKSTFCHFGPFPFDVKIERQKQAVFHQLQIRSFT